MSNRFETTFTALPQHIDENGHVNNTVWVRWMEELSVAHWQADALPDHVDAFAWVVTRHEIDYRGNVGEGAQVTGETIIKDGPRGARFDRHYEFRDADGKMLVRAKSTWAMVDRETARLMRVPPEVAAPFLPPEGEAG
ncbi:acyl-CoA thioesterase [Aurantiacibacter rhizosphaerae]|uniref:Acyl-CoA thioesterase n=1 Tax=Aurantiacibacter rhizosphaerae TaxID=2691582 RepID=A0A844XAL8_9SPHN|nr:acyl-CoA thioesterase [Aurantiacibacter rhizosphaerae]MWV26575.1 acyl-CoA thioesterase [Aurantiacibacter rhizosphaerae]